MPRRDRSRIGIVEDDPIMGESLVQRLGLEGYDPIWWTTGADALQTIGTDAPDLLLCDIRLPDMTGEDVFRAVVPHLCGAPVVFITGFADIAQAVRLVRSGAEDYLTKPFDMTVLLARIEELLAARAWRGGAGEAPLGRSEPMRRTERLLRRIADIDSSVLITGDSGVGKEVAAHFLHQQSARRDRPFMAVNCAAIPAELIDSELFGHERGAFTSAQALHRGYAERADDGILFLDEVADLPLPLQAKLLRLVQERAFFRVGGERPLRFGARLICATNADMTARVREGRFREDLFYRINVIPLAIPALRQRPADVPDLLGFYVGQFGELFGREVRGLTPAAEAAALAHDWPGNVRELRNRVERAVALCDGSWIGPRDLFPERGFAAPPCGEAALEPLATVRDDAERTHIRAALDRTGGQIAKAAEMLQVSRTTLWERMRRYGLLVDEIR